jgi:hypothetical protein
MRFSLVPKKGKQNKAAVQQRIAQAIAKPLAV